MGVGEQAGLLRCMRGVHSCPRPPCQPQTADLDSETTETWPGRLGEGVPAETHRRAVPHAVPDPRDRNLNPAGAVFWRWLKDHAAAVFSSWGTEGLLPSMNWPQPSWPPPPPEAYEEQNLAEGRMSTHSQAGACLALFVALLSSPLAWPKAPGTDRNPLSFSSASCQECRPMASLLPQVSPAVGRGWARSSPRWHLFKWPGFKACHCHWSAV